MSSWEVYRGASIDQSSLRFKVTCFITDIMTKVRFYWMFVHTCMAWHLIRRLVPPYWYCWLHTFLVQFTIFTLPIIHLVYASPSPPPQPPFSFLKYITIVFNFSWYDSNTQEKKDAYHLTENFGNSHRKLRRTFWGNPFIPVGAIQRECCLPFTKFSVSDSCYTNSHLFYIQTVADVAILR